MTESFETTIQAIPIKPYYRDEQADIVIYNSDCREILPLIPDKSIDLVLTSPPYNKCGTSGGLVKKVEYLDNMPECEYQSCQVAVLALCYRLLPDNGSVIYNHKIRYDYGAIFPISWLSKTPFIIWQELIWDRGITGNIRGWRFWNTDERLYWLVKQQPPELAQAYAQYTSIWRVRPENGITEHPAPFPIEIPIRAILALTNTNNVTLDPFLGSGTTAVAAKKLGRKCIGIEIEERYARIAVDRLRQSVMRLE